MLSAAELNQIAKENMKMVTPSDDRVEMFDNKVETAAKNGKFSAYLRAKVSEREWLKSYFEDYGYNVEMPENPDAHNACLKISW